MKLYLVYNGFMGFVAVRVLVVAESEQQARELAAPRFEARRGWQGPEYSNPARFDVELVLDRLDRPWASDAEDE